MSFPRAIDCEVQQWVTVTVSEALQTKERHALVPDKPEMRAVYRWTRMGVDEVLRKGFKGRCIECKEPVRAHRGSVGGMAPHFEHLTANPNCSRSYVG